MTSADLQSLLHTIGTDHVIAYFLVLARLTPLFLVAPAFASQMLLPQVRAVIALALALALTPVAAHGHPVPDTLLAIVGLLLVNFVVGFALAFSVACVFAAVQGAGSLADSFSGFSFGATIDPVDGNQGGALTTFYAMVGVILFLIIGGDAWTLRGISATFKVVPLTSGLSITAMRSMVGGAEALFGTIFVGAIEIAAPVMIAVVTADVAFGLVSRVVPQLNVFAVGFPVKVGVALLLVGVSLPFVAGWLSAQLGTAVAAAIQTL